MLPFWCGMMAFSSDACAVMTVIPAHMESGDMEMLQQVAGPEPGKTVVPPEIILKAVGSDLDVWILAAQAEHDTFITKEAV